MIKALRKLIVILLISYQYVIEVMWRTEMNKFTLVELLIVIVIIVILLSLLMPSLSRARYKAKSIACLNGQSQLAKITMQYAISNDSRYHAQNVGGASIHDVTHEFVTLKKDTGASTDLFFCPFRKKPYADEAWLSSHSFGRLGYGYWVKRFSKYSSSDIWSERILHKNSAEQILFSDTVFTRSSTGAFDEGWGTRHDMGGRMMGMNLVFADGHGESFKTSDIYQVYWTHVNFYGVDLTE